MLLFFVVNCKITVWVCYFLPVAKNITVWVCYFLPVAKIISLCLFTKSYLNQSNPHSRHTSFPLFVNILELSIVGIVCNLRQPFLNLDIFIFYPNNDQNRKVEDVDNWATHFSNVKRIELFKKVSKKHIYRPVLA